MNLSTSLASSVQFPLSVLVLFMVAATHISIRHEVKRRDARAKQAPWLHRTGSAASIRSAKIVFLVSGGFILGDLPMKVRASDDLAQKFVQ